MGNIGIICEYDPLHNGHAYQLRAARALAGADGAVVCAMSGNFVQRGHPAVYDRKLRAEAAARCGADLVVELPVQVSLSSAEGFARGGVELLARLCDGLCFGSECADREKLEATARVLLSPEFSPALRQRLGSGVSFPAARQQALQDLGADASALATPNDILGVEYCKAILSGGYAMTPMPILRAGSFHAEAPDPDAPSATSLRIIIKEGAPIDGYVPRAAAELYRGAAVHCREAGERAMLYRLRTMTEAEFEALPYGSEGLWRKLMRAARKYNTLEQILTAVKSKRYTRTRLDRMVMCAFLGLTGRELEAPVSYARVLAFTDRGRRLLAGQRKNGGFLHIGEEADHPQWALEQRCRDLYGLFTRDMTERAGLAGKERVFYLPEEKGENSHFIGEIPGNL